VGAPVPENQHELLDALCRRGILYTPPERANDELTELASSMCAIPIAVMGRSHSGCQWLKSSFGPHTVEGSQCISFCAHTIL
jgi:hypothetical protein